MCNFLSLASVTGRLEEPTGRNAVMWGFLFEGEKQEQEEQEAHNNYLLFSNDYAETFFFNQL